MDQETLKKAQQIIADEFAGPDGCHTVMIGLNKVDGQETGEPAIVCLVEDKMTAFKLRAHGLKMIPQTIVVDGVEIQTDVQIAPKPHDQRLWLRGDYFSVSALMNSGSQALSTHRVCHDAPMPGGVQIAPQGRNWVGTLGAAFKYGDKFGAITNAHVTDLKGTGFKMLQPGSGSAPPFAVVAKVGLIQFGGKANYIDAAILDTLMTGGPYGTGCHTVKPEQLDLGKINPQHVTAPKVGDLVHKTGRTTGVTKGRCVGVEATSYVGYDEGTAKFERQNVVAGDPGNFSAGGDSGSLVMTRDNRPWGLLFAGGGGQTICNPIGFVLEWAEGKFFQL